MHEAAFAMNWARRSLLMFAMIIITQAMSVNDGFQKDWVQYNAGPIIKYALIDHQTVAELAESNVLYYRDIMSSKIKGFIDLSLHESDDFLVGDATIATYSHQGSLVSIFEKKTGIFIDSISLNSPPLMLQEYNGYGWTILQYGSDERELVTWDGLALHSLGKFCASTFSQFSTPQLSHVCIDSTSFSLNLNKNGKEKSLNVSYEDFAAIKAVWFPLTNGFTLISKNNSPLTLGETIAASFNASHFVLHDISGKEASIIYSKTFDNITNIMSSGTFLVIVAEKQAHILDLAKFLETRSEMSISYRLVKVLPHVKLSILTEGHFTTLNSDQTGEKLTVHDYEIKNAKSRLIPLKKSSFSATGATIIVNVPPLESMIEKAHHLVEESRSLGFIHRWLLRVKSHLSQFGRLVFTTVSRKKVEERPIEEDVFGFNKIIVQIDEAGLLVAAKSSKNGENLWIHKLALEDKVLEVRALGSQVHVFFRNAAETLDLLTGKVLSYKQFSGPIEKVITLDTDVLEDGYESAKAFAVKIGDELEFLDGEYNVSASQFILHQYEDDLYSYKVDGRILRPTWQWNKPNQKILAISKNSDIITSAGGISRFDRSVLYKYLNPNLVSIISAGNETVVFTLLDGISGDVIYTHEHKGELIDPKSFCITQTDNWVVYSMFVLSPKSEQRLVVVDLFQDTKDSSRAVKTSFKSTNVTASAKTFLYPERILSLQSTVTKFGITVKSVIALTQSGGLIEIPKFLLNSRRIDDRKMKPEDQMDDYRMLPYEPVIPQNTFKILNHKNKLQIDEKLKILVMPTELESTSVVCLSNKLNDFCTIVQPSSSYDLLKSDFDKPKLILTIAVLVAAYIFSQPLVDSKRLNQKWID